MHPFRFIKIYRVYLVTINSSHNTNRYYIQ
ncbi:hypothetical protein QJUYFBOH_CDS0078 [Escherichia phage SHIN8]